MSFLLLLLALLTPADLSNKSLAELRLMRGEVFGRHGRMFGADRDIDQWLRAQSWYKPDRDYTNDALSDDDRRNLDLIREAEAEKHEHVEPGDLRWWQSRELTDAQLGQHSGLELRVMLAEIEAIHGRTFEETPTLQRYFSDRYWYEAKKYNPSVLSATERQNMAVIESAMKRERKVVLLPGDMAPYLDKRITPDMLDGLGLHELRLLRNEIYARRGWTFKAVWMTNAFVGYDWYTPADKQPEMTKLQLDNVAVIAARERELHDALATKKIDPAMLDGMFTEDLRRLRNEVYARHGRPFKDTDLREYFTSFPWYKPDPAFSEASLSPIEKSNVGVIRRLEVGAESRIGFEG